MRSANSTETDLRVAATSSAVPTATICWSFDRAEHKKRAMDKDGGAFAPQGLKNQAEIAILAMWTLCVK